MSSPVAAPHRVRQARVGVLLGPARSGTSLLYRTLCLHPDAAYVSNWVRRRPGLPGLAVLDRLPRALPGLRQKAWFGEDSNAYRYDQRRTALERLFPQPTEGEPLFRACGLVQHAGEQPLPRDEQVTRLRRAARGIVRASGARVLLTKRISHNRRVPELDAAFPDAVFVALVRDGRAVASSLARVDWWLDDVLWWSGTTPREWAAAGGDPWEACARNWVEDVDAMEAGLAGLPPERVVRLRYEDFLADPVPVLQRVAAAVGLDPDEPRWLAALRRLDFPDRNDAWRTRMPADAVETVERLQGPVLARYGYPVGGAA